MTGTQSQIEWAVQIKPRVGAEFDRVARVFTDIALRQKPEDRANTEAVLKILEEKRNEVMLNDFAGYFIREWQEITDQVRQLLRKDPRFEAIQQYKLNKSTRTEL